MIIVVKLRIREGPPFGPVDKGSAWTVLDGVDILVAFVLEHGDERVRRGQMRRVGKAVRARGREAHRRAVRPGSGLPPDGRRLAETWPPRGGSFITAALHGRAGARTNAPARGERGSYEARGLGVCRRAGRPAAGGQQVRAPGLLGAGRAEEQGQALPLLLGSLTGIAVRHDAAVASGLPAYPAVPDTRALPTQPAALSTTDAARWGPCPRGRRGRHERATVLRREDSRIVGVRRQALPPRLLLLLGEGEGGAPQGCLLGRELVRAGIVVGADGAEV